MIGKRRDAGNRLLTVLLLSLLIGHVLTLQFWPVGWFGDDLSYVRVAKLRLDDPVWTLFALGDDASCRYRPLTKTLVRAAYRREELAASIPRFANAVSLVLVVALAFILTRRLGVLRRHSLIGLVFFLLHQLPVATVYRNARMEHHFTVFGLLALLATQNYMAADTGRLGMGLRFLAIPVTLIVALLWSEGAAGFALLVPFAAWFAAGDRIGVGAAVRRRRIWAVGAAVALGVVAFVIVYAMAGGLLAGGGRFELRPGLPTLVNLATVVTGWVEPVSSIRLVQWLRDGPANPAGLGLAAGLSVFVVGLLLRGVNVVREADDRQRRAATLLGIAAVLVLFPVVFLQQISEVYVFPSVLFFCLAAGVLLGVQLEAQRGSRPIGKTARVGVLVLLAAYALVHVVAASEKVTALRRNGERFGRLARQLEERAAAGPGTVIHVGSQSPEEQPVSQYVLPIRLVWALGPQRGYEVLWTPEAGKSIGAPPDWWVAEDGTLAPAWLGR